MTRESSVTVVDGGSGRRRRETTRTVLERRLRDDKDTVGPTCGSGSLRVWCRLVTVHFDDWELDPVHGCPRVSDQPVCDR